jgi:uncharacterized protein YbbK (DUF523 family)
MARAGSREGQMKYVFSACLLGVECRYDGTSNENPEALDLWKREGGLVICPEQMGGLSTPRPPATLEGGDGRAALEGKARLVNEQGRDVTAAFLKGAQESARLAALSGAQTAYLKGGSPSCGWTRTNISWKRAPGCGVAAALLAGRGIKIIEID